jgi:hypothetical protein
MHTQHRLARCDWLAIVEASCGGSKAQTGGVDTRAAIRRVVDSGGGLESSSMPPSRRDGDEVVETRRG